MLGRVAAALIAISCSGCTTFRELPPETRAEEIAWQSLNAVDAAQTLSIAHDPDCYKETLSDPIIGKHPSPGVVLIWAAGGSALHLVVTDFLVHHTSPDIVRLWQGITIASSGYLVAHNYSIGLRVFSHNEPHAGQCGEEK